MNVTCVFSRTSVAPAQRQGNSHRDYSFCLPSTSPSAVYRRFVRLLHCCCRIASLFPSLGFPNRYTPRPHVTISENYAYVHDLRLSSLLLCGLSAMPRRELVVPYRLRLNTAPKTRVYIQAARYQPLVHSSWCLRAFRPEDEVVSKFCACCQMRIKTVPDPSSFVLNVDRR